MDKSIKIASVQMHVSNDNEKNLQTMEDCLKHIDNLFKDVDLVVFPELCSMSLDQTMEKQAEEIPGIISNLFSKWAKKYNKWLIPGSFYEKHSLENPFQGEFMQTITCLKCFHISSTKQKFNTLSLPIEGEKTTEELINDFQQEETVEYSCEKCKYNQCQKKLKVHTYPSTLVVHLKRFNGTTKIDTAVKLDNFLSYKLTAVCNHSGNTSAGHYTAAVKKSNSYLMISDNVCQEVNSLPEKSKFPYLLFFERYKRKRILL